MAASVAESTAEVESSRIRMAGLRSMARAMHSRCFWPPETLTPPWSSTVSKPVGEGHDKVIGLGVLGRLDHVLLGGVGVAPQQVLPDGAGEEHVGLEHHADAPPQLLQGIVPHVHPVHQHVRRR